MGIRGDIVFVNFESVVGSEQGKTRPAIIIQHNALNKNSRTTIVVPISSRVYEKEYPMHVRFEKLGPLSAGTVKVEQIRVIDKTRIQKCVGRVPDIFLRKIGRALQYTCDYF